MKSKDYTDENNCFWEGEENLPGVLKWYFIEMLGFCGCYDEDLFNDVIKTLLAFESGPVYYSKIDIDGPDKYKELILHAMDAQGILEHGFSIRGSWLTEKGKSIIAVIKENS